MKHQPLHVMAKPVDAQCNLDCDYCYFKSKPESESPPMDDETLATFIQQYIEASSEETVWFGWHGGEPTLAGLGFYQRVQRWQNMFASGRTVRNAIQTNGVLINEAWCEFLAEHQWLVGLSIDGLPRLHNQNRKLATDKGSYDQLEHALALLQTYPIAINAMVTVNRNNIDRPVETYQHLKDLGFRYMQFIPITVTDRNPDAKPWHISGEQYGRFLTKVFDEWHKKDIGHISIQDFESAYATAHGLPATVCTHSETCGNALVVLKKGEVYSCDHYVGSENYLGNLHHSDLSDLRLHPANVRFGLEKSLNLPEDCVSCPVQSQCRGGCRRHRINHDKNVLCNGYRRFFSHFNKQMGVPN